MEWYFWLGFILGLILYIWAAVEIRNAAYDKGYEGARYFWLPFLLGPAGWLTIVALPDLKLRKAMESIAAKLDRPTATPTAPPSATLSERRDMQQPASQRPATAQKGKPVTAYDHEPVAPMPGGSGGSEICPVCGEVQRAGRMICWNCGVPFRRE